MCFPRGCSSPTRARAVGALPLSRARCAMAARCLCSATASLTPSKPSSALRAMRTACNPVWAAANEDFKCLTPTPPRSSLAKHQPVSVLEKPWLFPPWGFIIINKTAFVRKCESFNWNDLWYLWSGMQNFQRHVLLFYENFSRPMLLNSTPATAGHDRGLSCNTNTE